MKLPQLGVSRPVTVMMLFLGLMMIGIYSALNLPLDLYPEIEPPEISVIITWTGASTKDVEEKLTEVVENQLAIVDGVDEIRSTSKEGISVVRLKFDWGTDLDAASNDIRDRLDFAAEMLPDDIEKPIIFKFNTSIIPVIFYGLQADTNWNELYDIADDTIAKDLESVPGVGSVQIFGGRKRQINLRLDPNALNARDISLAEIDAAIKAANVTKPAGSMKVGRIQYTIRIPAEFEKPEEIEGLIIKTSGDAAVYMKDILVDRRITLGFVERTEVAKVDGRESMWMVVQKRSGANTVDVTRRVRERMEETKKKLPEDVKVIELFDTSTFIENSLSNLGMTVLVGGVLVVIVTLLFLRNLRSSAVIAITIPFSLIIAFIFLYLLGFTINIISLASIAIGIGLVVDNSVVVLENVIGHVERGEKVGEASVYGAAEVGNAITASTLTTIVVFLPLLFLTGMVGIMFTQLAVAVTVTIAASLFCALLLTPMLCSRLLKPAEQMLPSNPFLRKFYLTSEDIFKKIESSYSSVLGWALRHKGTVLAIGGFALAVTVALLPAVGSEFFPAQDAGDLKIRYRLKVGTKAEETAEVTDYIDKVMNELGGEAVKISFTECGEPSSGLSSAFGRGRGSYIGEVSAKLVPVSERDFRAEELGQRVIEKVKQSKYAPYIEKIHYDAGNPLDRLLQGGGQPISMEILGYDLEESYKIAEQLKEIIEHTPGGKNPTISLKLGRPELQLKIDKQKARDVGADADAVARDIETLYRGSTASTYRKGSREYDIELRLAPEYRQDTEQILDTVITLPNGRKIVAATIARLEREQGPVTIERKNRQRVVRVDAQAFQRSLGEVVRDVEKKIEELRAEGKIPSGVNIEQGGQVKEQRESFGDLYILLAMGIILVFMVMASQFESLKLPFVVMFSVPFAFSGVIAFLVLTGTTLNLMSFIGTILLVGIVVNNAIVLIDYINILRARGYDITEAVKTAGARRLRPVLMTAFTTIFGMLPLALAPGEGSEMWRPIGVTVIGGLLVSTLVTLILVPTIYSMFERREKHKKVKEVQGETPDGGI